MRQMLDEDLSLRGDTFNTAGVELHATVHYRSKAYSALAEEPDVVLRPIIGLWIERSQDPMPQRQGDGVGGGAGVQVGDRRRVKHLVVIQEGDPVVATLFQGEGARFFNRWRPWHRNHLVGVSPGNCRRVVGR